MSERLNYADLSSARIAYIDVGAGEPVICVHGFASSHLFNWVNPGWVETILRSGRRVVALDNRGHGASEKFYRPEDYARELMAGDVIELAEYLGLARAHLLGYSMGARISAHVGILAAGLTRSIVLGGLGWNMVAGVGLPAPVADGLVAASLDEISDPMARMFRQFAETTGSDRFALAACIKATRQHLGEDEVATITAPVLVAIGTNDPIAGSAAKLAAVLPRGEAFDIERRDHMLAVGDRAFKARALRFWDEVEGR